MESDVARARARSHDSGTAVNLTQSSGLDVEPIEEHAVGPEVCREQETIGWIGNDAVGMGPFLPLGVRSLSRVLIHSRGGAECTVRLDGQHGHAARRIVGDEGSAAALVQAHIAGRATARWLRVEFGQSTRGAVDRQGTHRALVELVDGIQRFPAGMNREE